MASGSEQRQRQEALRIRLTSAEHAAVSEAADQAGLSLAGYARAILLAAEPPRQSRRPPANKAELAVILGQLGKIGSNVNQIARVLNSGGDPDPPELACAIAEIDAMHTAIMAALGRVP